MDNHSYLSFEVPECCRGGMVLGACLIIIISLKPPVAWADQTSCGAPQVLEPGTSVINESRPVIRWTPVAEANHYRIQLRSRVPEGKALVTLDTIVQGVEFRPPQALTDYRAQTQVTVSASCRGVSGPPSNTNLGGRFYIDTAPLCVLSPTFKIQRDGSQWHIAWTTVSQADLYHVTVFEGQEGRQLLHQEVRQPKAVLSLPTRDVAFAVVRPHCVTGWGEPVYQPLAFD